MQNPARPFFDWIGETSSGHGRPPLFFDGREENVKAARAFGWEAVQ